MTHDESRERNVRIVEALKGGTPREVLVARYGIGDETIRRIARMHGLGPRAGVNSGPRPQTVERNAAVLEAVRAGEDTIAIMRRFNLSRTYIHAICADGGLPMPGKSKLAARRREIVDAVEAGEALASVSRRFGVRVSRIRVLCRERGIVIPAGARLHVFRVLADLFDVSLSQAQIAAKYDVPQSRVSDVYRMAREVGIPVPERSHAGGRGKSRAS